MQVEHFRNNHEVLLRLLVELVLILQSNLSRTQLVRQPCALEMVKITLGQESEKKLKDISPSNDIAQSVRDLAEDIKTAGNFRSKICSIWAFRNRDSSNYRCFCLLSVCGVLQMIYRQT